jgi:hypothetical protein
MQKKAPPNRSTDASCFVRMGNDQREVLVDSAQRKLGTAGIAGARFGLGKFLLAAGLKEALRELVWATVDVLPEGEMFSVADVVKKAKCPENLTYTVLDVLRDMATRKELQQHSATDFFKRPPKK